MVIGHRVTILVAYNGEHWLSYRQYRNCSRSSLLSNGVLHTVFVLTGGVHSHHVHADDFLVAFRPESLPAEPQDSGFSLALRPKSPFASSPSMHTTHCRFSHTLAPDTRQTLTRAPHLQHQQHKIKAQTHTTALGTELGDFFSRAHKTEKLCVSCCCWGGQARARKKCETK